MTPEIALVFVLIAAALYSFVTELLPIEVTAMTLLALLLLTGLVTTEEALAGLSNKAVVTVGAMLVLSHALVKTGVIDQLAEWLGRRGANWPGMVVMLAIAALLSGFLNNTAVVAIFVPLAIDLCRRSDISPSRVLLPLSYAAIVGGTLTLIGTSTNLLVSAISESSGYGALGMFEFARFGVLLLVVGLGYVALFAPRLLPPRQPAQSLARRFGLAPYLAELRVEPESTLVGQSPRESAIGNRYNVAVLKVHRHGQRPVSGVADTVLEPGDVMLVRGAINDLIRLERELGVKLFADAEPSEEELRAEGQVLAEVILPAQSPLIGRTLRGIDFRRVYDAQVLAIQSEGQTVFSNVANHRLTASSSLLIFTTEERLEQLRQSEDFWVISELELRRRRERTWWLVLLLYPAVILLAAAGVVDIVKGAVIATIALLTFKAMKPSEAYQAVNWSVLFLIASFVPLGHAMVSTGAADLLASLLVSSAGFFPEKITAHAVLALLYLTTMLTTQLVSNNAAAIIVLPITFSLSQTLGVDPKPFIMTVCFAASAEFMTPYGYQTNLMVYSPGKYRFIDYLKFGTPLNLTFWVLGSLFIPVLWPF